MGDGSTHLIYYQSYWSLVHKDEFDKGLWLDSRGGFIVCEVGKEEKIVTLSEVK